MKKKGIVLVALAVMMAIPALAVFNEKDLAQTLMVLRSELDQEVQKRSTSQGNIDRRNLSQHKRMIQVMKSCNELALMLYSQNQDYTFDMTYALKEVTRQYDEFNENRMPFDEIIARLDLEIDRYSRLVESLRRLPPQLKEIEELPDSLAYHNDSIKTSALFSRVRPMPERERMFRRDSLNARGHKSAFFLDDKGQADRDSCIHYATTLLKMYQKSKDRIVADNEHYDDAHDRLKESYDYAQNRYKVLQRRIFIQGQDNYFTVLSTFPSYASRAFTEAGDKYRKSNLFRNYWDKAHGLLFTFFWFVLAIFISLFFRVEKGRRRSSLQLYLPIVVAGVLVIAFRILFVPNKLLNLLFPPLMLGALVWQFYVTLKNRKAAKSSDVAINVFSIIVLLGATVSAWMGYIFMSIQVVVWWLFQVASIATIFTLYLALKWVGKNKLEPALERWKNEHKHFGPKNGKGDYIRVTWMYDMIEMAVLPLLATLSIPLCVRLALNVFDLSEIYKTILYSPFFNFSDTSGNVILHLSLYKLILSVSLFFVFRYLCYFFKAFYRDIRLATLRSRSGGGHIHTNEVNLTLANNVISILVWFVYIVILVLLLKIPMGAVSIIAAGLATGLGLAMKDILNNFIYGIQLMSGRLRVGDWMECDGIRGKVSAISYQSTQIETIDGAVMSFLNTALFNKNFKNLTRNNSYEFVKIVVGVAYGTEVEKVRVILLEALESIRSKDSFGRDIVDPDRGFTIAFEEFGDSSVDIAVKQYVLVSERSGYIARAKETIYNALGKAGIEIPFPQRDIHVISQ